MDSKTRAMLQCSGYNLDLDTNMSFLDKEFRDDYEKFATIFYKYGSQPHLKIDVESHFVHSIGGSSFPYAGREYISLDGKSLDVGSGR